MKTRYTTLQRILKVEHYEWSWGLVSTGFITYSMQKSRLIHAAQNVWEPYYLHTDPPLLHLISPLIYVYLGNTKNIVPTILKKEEFLNLTLIIDGLWFSAMILRVKMCEFQQICFAWLLIFWILILSEFTNQGHK